MATKVKAPKMTKGAGGGGGRLEKAALAKAQGKVGDCCRVRGN